MERDLYELLGVSKSASADDLKQAHRKIVRQYHADKRFAEIQEAYDILSDPEKRKLYDQFGIAGVKAGPAGGAGPGAGAGGPFGGGSPFGGQGGAGWQGVDPATFEGGARAAPAGAPADSAAASRTRSRRSSAASTTRSRRRSTSPPRRAAARAASR